MNASALPKTSLTTLEFVRRTAGMSRPELAERSGVSVATILASERFGRVPHLATARRLAHVLNLAVASSSPKENTMTNDRPITPEQALLAVKAAGLDPDKSLNQQLREDRNDALERQVEDLNERVKTLTEALGAQGGAGQPAEPHELLAEKLHAAQSEWLTLGGPDGKAA